MVGFFKLKKRFIEKKIEIIWFVVIWTIYLSLQSRSIFGGDAGDLAAAAYVWGIPHSPGYPLYTFLGGLLTRIIPVSTVAWRIGLLSSFFAALSVCVFYQMLVRLTQNKLLAAVGGLILAFLYPFWLYAEVTEVFSLSVFIILMIVYLSLSFREKPKVNRLNWLAFFFGLSLAHHHIIVFIIPMIAAILWPVKKGIVKLLFNFKNFLFFIFYFLFGLIPLLYLPIAASFYPPIDWEHPTTFSSFLQLFLRTTYGTFKAGSFINDSPIARLYSYLGFYKLFLIDLKPLGIILLILGLIESYRRKILFWPLLTGFLSFSFFLFYASFPLSNEFSLATFERFTIFPYLFCIIFIVLGIQLFLSVIPDLIGNLDSRFRGNDKMVLYRIESLATLLFFIYPLGLFIRNFPPISSLKNDFTAENVALDMLKSAPENSLLLLINDTAIFNTQYIYYSQNYQSRIKLLPIHFYKLFRPYYHESLKRLYPSIILPDPSKISEEEFVSQFIDLNADKYIIMTNFYLANKKENLIPYGLLWRYDKNSRQYSLASVLETNARLWFSYQKIDEREEIFKNLFLTDILRIYSTSHQNYANYLLEKGQIEEALVHLNEAQKLTPEDSDISFLEGLIYAKKAECELSEKHFLEYKKGNPENRMVLEKLIDLAHSCFKNEEKASEYRNELKILQEKSAPKIKDL